MPLSRSSPHRLRQTFTETNSPAHGGAGNGRVISRPSGFYCQQFLPWLKAEGVISATTCDTGLATYRSDALLLPRFIDTTGRSGLEFESWLTGVGDLLAIRRRARGNTFPEI